MLENARTYQESFGAVWWKNQLKNRIKIGIRDRLKEAKEKGNKESFLPNEER
jgi:hypothetical protein